MIAVVVVVGIQGKKEMSFVPSLRRGFEGEGLNKKTVSDVYKYEIEIALGSSDGRYGRKLDAVNGARAIK